MYYDRMDDSERIDVTKSSRSKECMLCHYWYFFLLAIDMNQKYVIAVMTCQ